MQILKRELEFQWGIMNTGGKSSVTHWLTCQTAITKYWRLALFIGKSL